MGTIYEKQDCSQCLCKLGGVSQCRQKQCDKCPAGLRSVLTATCGCVCQPCPPAQLLCPTSDICIDQEKWCNGVQDCPDDEKGCPTTVPPAVTTIEPLVRSTKLLPGRYLVCTVFPLCLCLSWRIIGEYVAVPYSEY